MKKWLVLIALFMAAMPGKVFAQDEGLYDPVAPEGSAFVRFVNAGAKDESVKPSVAGKTINEVDHGKIGAYVPVKEGKIALAAGAAKAEQALEKGNYYTAVLDADTLTVLQDEKIKDQTKSLVAFYNLSGKKLSLKTADGKIEVVAPVEQGKSGSREINPLAVQLAVYDGDTKAADVPAVDLKRNAATTVVALKDKDGKVTAMQAQATTDTTQ